jgi:poly(A) polymerase
VPDQPRRRAVAAASSIDVVTRMSDLVAHAPEADDLGRRFTTAGFELALVGGSVRDVLLGREGVDLDFATSARPDATESLLAAWGDVTWDIGKAFGTIGARRGDVHVEVTTYRAEAYDADSRKPVVVYGDTLDGDLRRRDFTINAMAVRLPDRTFVDPFHGLVDLAAGVIQTPGTPEESFSDDPLRMLRAARFVAQLGFDVAPEVVAAMTAMAERIDIVSAERVRDELSKLLCGAYPSRGLSLLVDTGLAHRVLPELPALQLEIDEHHRHKDVYQHTLTVLDQAIDLEDDGPDEALRWAALLHDVGKPRTRAYEPGGGVSFHHHETVGARMTAKRMKALRFPSALTDDVARLVELHLRFHGYADGEWTDSAVRRYVRDAGDLLTRLHKLTRADCTTRNRRRAAALAGAYDDLEARIERLAEAEELAAIRPDLDGNQIMSVLGIGPGRAVGEARDFLLELRLDRGPIGEQAAADALREWWAASHPD